MVSNQKQLKFMLRSFVKELEEVVVPKEVKEEHAEDCVYQRKGCDCGYMERFNFNRTVREIKDKFKWND